MQFFTTAISLVVISLCTEAKLINVVVGNEGLFFKPSTIVAAVGDEVQFNFYNNHSVVQSSFAKPCYPIKNGFFSGFVASENDGPAKNGFIVTVKNKNAIWFYCSQGEHCQDGMAGAINAPGGENALSSYLDAALMAPENVSPTTGVFGGRLGPVIPSGPLSFLSTKVTSSPSATSSKPEAILSATTPKIATAHAPSVTSNKASSNSATSSKTKSGVSTTPSSSKASRRHTVSKTATLAILTTVASLRTTSCTWRG